MVRVGRKKLWSVSSHVCVQIALWLLVWASLLAIRSAMGLQISIRNQEALVRAPSCLLSAATIDIVNTENRDCLIQSIQLGPETTVQVAPASVFTNEPIHALPQQFHPINLEGNSLSLSPGQVASISIPFLPRFPRYWESTEARPPDLTPGQITTAQEWPSHWSDTRDNMHLASSYQSTPPSLDEYRISSTVVVNTETDGMYSIPVEATSVRQNAFGIPDSILLPPSGTSKPTRQSTPTISEAPSFSLSDDTGRCAQMGEEHGQTISSKNERSDCYDLYIRHPKHLDDVDGRQSLSIQSVAVSHPDKASLHLSAENINDLSLSMLSNKQVIQSWTSDETISSRQVPLDGEPHYLATVCPYAAKTKELETDSLLQEKYGSWMSSMESKNSLGFLMIQSDKLVLVSELVTQGVQNKTGSPNQADFGLNELSTQVDAPLQPVRERIQIKVGSLTGVFSSVIPVSVQSTASEDALVGDTSLVFDKKSAVTMRKYGLSVSFDSVPIRDETRIEEKGTLAVGHLKVTLDKEKSENTPGIQEVLGKVLIRSKSLRSAESSLQTEHEGAHPDPQSTTEVPFSIEITGGKIVFSVRDMNSVPGRFLFARKSRDMLAIVEAAFFPLFQRSDAPSSEQVADYNPMMVEHVLEIQSSFPCVVSLTHADILDGQGVSAKLNPKSLCNRFQVSIMPARNISKRHDDNTSKDSSQSIGQIRLGYRIPRDRSAKSSAENLDPTVCYVEAQKQPGEDKVRLPLIIYIGDLGAGIHESYPSIFDEEHDQLAPDEQIKVGVREITNWTLSTPEGISFGSTLRRAYGGLNGATWKKYFADFLKRLDSRTLRYRPILLNIGAVDEGQTGIFPLFLENRNPVPISISWNTLNMEGFGMRLGRDRVGPFGVDGLSDVVGRVWTRTKESMQHDRSMRSLDRIHNQRLESLFQFLKTSQVPLRFFESFGFRDAVYSGQFIPGILQRLNLDLPRNDTSFARFHRHAEAHNVSCDPQECDNVDPHLAAGLFAIHTRKFMDRCRCATLESNVIIPPFGTVRLDVAVTAPKESELDLDINHFVATGTVITSDHGESIPVLVSFEVPRGGIVFSQRTKAREAVRSTLHAETTNALFKNAPSSVISELTMGPKAGDESATMQEDQDFVYAESSFRRNITLLEVESCNPWFTVALLEDVDEFKSEQSLGRKIGTLRHAVPCDSLYTRPGFDSFFACALSWMSMWSDLQKTGCGTAGVDLVASHQISTRDLDEVSRVFNRMLQLSAWSFSGHAALEYDYTGPDFIHDGYVRPLVVALSEAVWDIFRRLDGADIFTMSTDLRATIKYHHDDTGLPQETSVPVRNDTVISKLTLPSLLDREKLGIMQNDESMKNEVMFRPTLVGTATSLKIPLLNPTGVPVRVKLSALMPDDSIEDDFEDNGQDPYYDPGFAVSDPHFTAHSSPYVQGPLYSELGFDQINLQWWDGPGCFVFPNFHGDLIRAHHNVSVRAGSHAYVGLVSPSLLSSTSFLYGCAQRCGIHDDPVKRDSTLELQQRTMIGSAAASGAVLVGRDRSAESAEDEFPTSSQEEFAFQSGGSIHTGGKGPAAFGVARAALIEILLEPFGTAEIGPIYFRPPGRFPLMTSVLPTGETGFVKSAGVDSLFSAKLYLENSLTGLEQLTLIGKALWESVEFLDAEDGSFSDIEFRHGMPCLVFPGTLLPPFPTNQAILKEVMLKNNGDTPLSFKQAYLSRTTTPRESSTRKLCSLSGFHLLNCSNEETFAPLQLSPGESTSFFLSYKPTCATRSGYISLKVQYNKDAHEDDDERRHTHDPSWRARHAQKRTASFRPATETLVIGYEMSNEVFRNCIPWNTDLFPVLPGYGDILSPENQTRMIERLDGVTYTSSEKQRQAQPPSFAFVFPYATFCLVFGVATFYTFKLRKGSYEALQKKARRLDRLSLQAEKRCQPTRWNRTWDDADPVELELQSNKLVSRQLLVDLRAVGAMQPHCVTRDGVFQRDRSHLVASASGLKGKTRTVSETLFNGIVSERSHDGHLPVNLGWRAALARGIINERSLKRIQGQLETHHLLINRSRRRISAPHRSTGAAGQLASSKVRSYDPSQKNEGISLSEVGLGSGEAELPGKASKVELSVPDTPTNGRTHHTHSRVSSDSESDAKMSEPELSEAESLGQSSHSGFKTIGSEKNSRSHSRRNTPRKTSPRIATKSSPNKSEQERAMKSPAQQKSAASSASSVRQAPVNYVPSDKARGWAQVAASNSEVIRSSPLRPPPGLAPPPGFSSPTTGVPLLDSSVGLGSEPLEPPEHTRAPSEISSHSGDNVFPTNSPLLGPSYLSREDSVDELPSLTMLLGGTLSETLPPTDETNDDFDVLDFLDGILNDGSNNSSTGQIQLDADASDRPNLSDALDMPLSVDPLVLRNPWAEDEGHVKNSRATLYGIPLTKNEGSNGSNAQEPPLQDWLTLSLSGAPSIEHEFTEHRTPQQAQREEEDEIDPAEALMQRGAQLRQLRALALQDEVDRQQLQGEDRPDQQSASTASVELADGSRVLRYESWLSHQEFHDDLKHIDYKYIDFGGDNEFSLVVEQDKTLGKGGICWDAAFILGDHVKALFLNKQLSTPKRVVELGCGTGLCGMMIAKAVAGLEVRLTDLPELMPLLLRNIENNFNGTTSLPTGHRNLEGKSPVIGQVLDWAEVAASPERHTTYDVILGADVVASLYDPVALATTIHALAHRESLVLLTFKERLSTMHRQFENELSNLFEEWTVEEPSNSRNRNPHVKIVVARRPKVKT